MKLMKISLILIFIFLFLTKAFANYLSFNNISFDVESDINSMFYGTKNGLFIAVGDGGYIGTSSDGIYWYASNSKTGEDLKAVTYRYSSVDNDIYMAVGSSGTVVYSYDGITWFKDKKITEKGLNGISNRSALFVAVGESGTILRTNGIGNWEQVLSPTTNNLMSITYGNGLFVVVGNNGTILSSSDGQIWSQCLSPVSVNLKSVSFGNGMFIAVGDSGVILRSLDGLVWVQQNSRTGSSLKAVSYGDFAFFAVGQNGTVMLSGDGITWEQLYTGSNIWFNSVLYRNQIFLATGYNGSGIRAYNNYIVANPSFINFGQLAPNTSFTQPINVINRGSFPLTISLVSKSGSNQFQIKNDLCSGATLQPSGVCRIDVSYTSGIAGQNSASIVIKSSTLPVSTTVSLKATSTGVLYDLSVTKTGNGSGNVFSSTGGISCGSNCTGKILGTSIVTLYAIPSNGSSFGGWTGYSACVTNNPCTFTMTGNVNINAEFQ